MPQDPITAIVDAFDSHNVVAFGEGMHRNDQSHALRLALIRDPRFTAVVNDIVVEFGNARYQEVMDRFVRGEDVPREELRQVWQNTTQAHAVWDVPIYEEFYRAVRNVNASLAPDRQLRVLLGDPPIDWDNRNSEDVRALGGRSGHAVEVIKREVLARERRGWSSTVTGTFIARMRWPTTGIRMASSPS